MINFVTYMAIKILSKSLAEKLISDVIKMYDILGVPGYLVTMDIEKAFDSLNHDFLKCFLKNWFG